MLGLYALSLSMLICCDIRTRKMKENSSVVDGYGCRGTLVYIFNAASAFLFYYFCALCCI